jgi:hypothetical protein
MRKNGNRNFGVWNPPSGMDNIKLATKIDFESVIKLNNLNDQAGQKLGIRQFFGLPVFKVKFLGEQLNAVNSNNIFFVKMMQQGWGGK